MLNLRRSKSPPERGPLLTYDSNFVMSAVWALYMGDLIGEREADLGGFGNRGREWFARELRRNGIGDASGD